MKLRLFLLALAVAALAFALVRLREGSDGVTRETVAIGVIPATLFHPPSGAPKALVVVAHGFAGSQQMMAPLATTLARDGYLALTFDFAGHGRNPLSMPGGIKDMAESTRALTAEVGAALDFARTRPEFNGKLALLGHSMASDLVVQAAMARDDVNAVVALSLFGAGVTATGPNNLLVMDGAWEPAMLRDAARRIVSLTRPDPREGETYADFSAGTARRYAYARGVEHIGVIWSLDAQHAARDWLDAAFAAAPVATGVDRRGPWIGLMGLALCALVGIGVGFAPRLAARAPSAPVSPGRFYALAGFAALATPVLLWKAPTDFLPILLGDYLAAHFAVYGALLWAGLLWLRRPPGPAAPPLVPVLVAGVALAAFYLIAFGVPLDLYVTSFWPVGRRWALIPVEAVAVALAFTAEERLARGEGAPRLAYAALKLGFVVSLIAAIALNPVRLFVLAIVAPVVAALFVAFGFLNRAAFTRTRAPLAGALGAALALAYAISVTFPMVE
jgi:dienelactone hydrolase